MATPEGARFCLMASIISRQTSTLVRTSLEILLSCTVCAFDRSTWLKGILLQRKIAGSPESTHWWATQNVQEHQKVPTSGLLKIYRITRKCPLVGYLKMTLLVSHFWHSYDLGNWVIDQIYVNYHLHWISGKVTHGKYSERIIVVVVDHFYIALFSARKQTQSTRMWFYMSD